RGPRGAEPEPHWNDRGGLVVRGSLGGGQDHHEVPQGERRQREAPGQGRHHGGRIPDRAARRARARDAARQGCAPSDAPCADAGPGPEPGPTAGCACPEFGLRARRASPPARRGRWRLIGPGISLNRHKEHTRALKNPGAWIEEKDLTMANMNVDQKVAELNTCTVTET